MLVFFTYLFLINVAAFTCYAIDKFWSETEHLRIPERTLLALSVAGGAYGAGAGMLLFRHKTLHRNFQLAVPICFALWAILIVALSLI